MNSLNEVFSSLSTRRRYEVWFVRLGLADGSGAWWFRYLLMNPGRSGCADHSQGMPVQVWATWFPSHAKAETFIQAWSLDGLELATKREPFHFRTGNTAIEENSCRGALQVNEHSVDWHLQYASTFRTTLSDKSWIGFSRTPHSDATFSGQITLDGKRFEGNPLGFGLQGHNCGYRHRSFWIWTHSFFFRPNSPPSTFEALVYDMPFGLTFRKAMLWHNQKQYVFRNLHEAGRDPRTLHWNFHSRNRDGCQLEGAIDGAGPSLHVLPYLKTDCSGSFDVTNNSLAQATVYLRDKNGAVEKLETRSGAVLEMGGRVPEIGLDMPSGA